MTFPALSSRSHARRVLALALSLPPLLAIAQSAGDPPSAPAQGEVRDTRAEHVELVRDSSVGESVSRRTNVNFESVRIDGQRSNAALSSLSAEQVANVESTKVPTPDLDADAVGGLLRVTTRRAYEQDGRTVRGEFVLGYDELAERFSPDVSLTFGDVFGRNDRWGFLGTVQLQQTERAEEEIELGWNRPGDELEEIEVGLERERQRSVSVNGALERRLGPESFAFVRMEGSFDRERRDNYSVSHDLENASSELNAEEVLLADVRERRRARGALARSFDATVTTGLTLKDEARTIELTAGHTRMGARESDSYNFEFTRSGLTYLYSRPEATFPRLRPAPGTPEAGDDSRLNELKVTKEDADETDSMASADVTFHRPFGDRAGWVKTGAKLRMLGTDNSVHNDIYFEGPAGVRIDDAPFDGPNREVLEGRYRVDRMPSVATLGSFFERTPSAFARDADRSRGETDPEIYDVSQRVSAAYGMGGFGWGATKILAGFRVERTHNAFTANEVIFDDEGRYEGTRAVEADASYTNWFPGVHFTRPFGENVTLYASWTKSIIRPEYTDLVPARSIQRSSREIREGNPGLRPTLYTNFDFAVDYAYSDKGAIVLQVYHRDIEDPALSRSIRLSEGPFAGYDRERPENGGAAKLSGFDLTWEQALGALGGLVDDSSLEMTYTYRRSRQQIDGRADDALSLAGEPEHRVGASFGLERGGYELNLQAEYEGRSLRSAGRNPNEDSFVRGATRWEMEISRKVGSRGRLFIEVENLTAEAEQSYQGTAARPDAFELELREYRTGFRWEI